MTHGEVATTPTTHREVATTLDHVGALNSLRCLAEPNDPAQQPGPPRTATNSLEPKWRAGSAAAFGSALPPTQLRRACPRIGTKPLVHLDLRLVHRHHLRMWMHLPRELDGPFVPMGEGFRW